MDTRRCLEILELESVSSPEELKRAYRDMVQIWHPDRFQGNDRLLIIADAKLKEINQAYKHLLAYFDPEQSRRLRTSTPGARAKFSEFDQRLGTYNHPGRRTAAFLDSKEEAGSQQSGQFSNLKIYPAKKKSPLGKIFLFLAFCIFLVVSGLVVYFISNMDKLASESVGVTSEALKMIKIELEKEIVTQPAEDKQDPQPSPAAGFGLNDPGAETASDDTIKYFEIHLEGNTIIMTASWWQQDDMIMYTQFGGSMGVEKNRVQRIVEKQAARSGLTF